MNDHMVMLDIETTGVDFKKDDILQIAMVHMELRQDDEALPPKWVPGNNFNFKLHTDKKPMSQFAKEHMVALYKQCNAIKRMSARKVRERVLRGLNRIWPMSLGPIQFSGWNAGIFDVTFLREKKYLLPSGYVTVNGKDKMVGDYHYRVYGIEGAFQMTMDAFGVTKDELNAKLEEMPRTFKHDIFDRAKEHDALYDCYDQIDVINKLIQLNRLGPGRVTFPIPKKGKKK